MVVLKFQTDLAKAPYANDEPLTCSERAWRALPPRPVVLKTTEGRVLCVRSTKGRQGQL